MVKIPATIKDIAKYTGLSIATISKYLNGGNVLEKNAPSLAFVKKANEESNKYELFIHSDFFENKNLFDNYLWFVILHEMLHIRFNHLNRFKKLMKRNRGIVNIGLDIFINEILKELSKGTRFEISTHDSFYSDLYFISTLDRHNKQEAFGIKLNPQKLNITKEMSDKEIVAVLFATLEPAFEKLSKIIGEAMEKVSKEMFPDNNFNSGPNSSNSNSNANSSNDNSNNSNSSDSNQGNSSSGNGNFTLKDYIDKVLDEVGKRFREEYSTDKDFKEGINKAASVSDIEEQVKREILERLFGNPLDSDDDDSDDSDVKEKIANFVKANKEKLRGLTGSLLREFVDSQDKLVVSSINAVINQVFNRAESSGVLKKIYKYPNKKIQGGKVILPKVDFDVGFLAKRKDYLFGLSFLNLKGGRAFFGFDRVTKFSVSRIMDETSLGFGFSVKNADYSSYYFSLSFSQLFRTYRYGYFCFVNSLFLGKKRDGINFGIFYNKDLWELAYSFGFSLNRPYKFSNGVSLTIYFGRRDVESDYERIIKREVKYRKDLMLELVNAAKRAERLKKDIARMQKDFDELSYNLKNLEEKINLEKKEKENIILEKQRIKEKIRKEIQEVSIC